jgi:DNA-binding Lrp family transcriptional regulator
MKMKAYVLIKCSAGRVATVLKQIRNVKGVECAEAVVGPYDIIAYVEAENINELGKMVVDKIQKVIGVENTLTSICVEL